VLALGALVSLTLGEKIGPVSVDKSILRFFPFFWLGLLLADARPWIADKVAALSRAKASALGWLGLFVYLVIPQAPENLAGGLATRAAVYATLVAMFVSAWAPQSGFRAFCAKPWVSLIGGACYSLYLVHMQTAQAISMAAAKVLPNMGLSLVFPLMLLEYVAIVAAGLVFYVLVERTFMLPNWHLALTRWLRGASTEPRPTAAE
jgi:peptidoglycan/LPS O-acetylase OafA/YrhL